MNVRLFSAALALCAVLFGCGGGGASTLPASGTPASPAPQVQMWKPTPFDSFQWILSSALDTSSAASVYDIDGFNSSAADVAALHRLGRHAVCYINVGAYENFRTDASSFPAQVIGNAYAGWPGENWLDIRRIDVLAPIMQSRFDMCKAKGFDAIEPDNINGSENTTGFPLSAADQITYNTWIASIAHARGMSIALKNDDTQVAQLAPLYDFAITEDCWQQRWCSQMAAFHNAGEAVFTVEYTDVTTPTTFTSTYCGQAKTAGFNAILKKRQLDAWVQTCP